MFKASLPITRFVTKTVDLYQTSMHWFLFFAAFLMTIGSSAGFLKLGVGTLFEYLGLMLLLLGCFARFLKNTRRFKTPAFILLITVLILFNIGLLFQTLPLSNILKLMISMVILAVIAIFPSDYIQSIPDLRKIGWGFLLGTVCSTFAALITDISIITRASEGFLVNFGYNGGFEHRNYFSYSLIVAFISFYMPFRYGHRKAADLPCMLISLLLLLLTNSRGAYLVFAAFLLFDNCTSITIPFYGKKLRPGQAAIIACIAAIPVYILLVITSETFYFRINGLINYLEVFCTDVFHMLFGNAEIAYRETGLTYDQNIRSVIGWDGSVELVLLNILIKNGLLGLIGFILIFVRYFKKVRRIKNTGYQTFMYALILSFLMSAFIESFLANINFSYGTFSYTVIASILPVLSNMRPNIP